MIFYFCVLCTVKAEDVCYNVGKVVFRLTLKKHINTKHNSAKSNTEKKEVKESNDAPESSEICELCESCENCDYFKNSERCEMCKMAMFAWAAKQCGVEFP